MRPDIENPSIWPRQGGTPPFYPRINMKKSFNKGGTHYSQPYSLMFPLKIGKRLKQQVEQMVMNWLRSNSGPRLEINLYSKDDRKKVAKTIAFSKGVMNIKHCSNGWDEWWFAHSTDWPTMISFQSRYICKNDFQKGDTRLNEVKDCCYDQKLQKLKPCLSLCQ